MVGIECHELDVMVVDLSFMLCLLGWDRDGIGGVFRLSGAFVCVFVYSGLGYISCSIP